MSTSPSWFDQEKFSRLVKKVGPKTITEVLPSTLGAETPENRPVGTGGEGLASTARISLVSKPPSLLSEHRALPALPRRTSAMPSAKKLFSKPDFTPQESTLTEAKEAPSPEKSEPAAPAEPKEEAPTVISVASIHDGEVLSELWQKMGLLNEELAHAISERDQAVNEVDLLRERLGQIEEAMKSRGTKMPGQTQELTVLTTERDQARKEYMLLRSQFEAFKQETNAKDEPIKVRRELEQQVEGFRQKLEERTKELLALKGSVNAAGGDEKLKEEITFLRDQVARLKDEASVAQRGLALSQKALHETRETLREATEGTSLSRHNFDNIKAECANLAQQNAVLQAQNDQLTRDLAAVRSKVTTRVKM